MKDLTAEDLERIAEQLIETGNLIRQHGRDALRVTEGWKPGPKPPPPANTQSGWHGG